MRGVKEATVRTNRLAAVDAKDVLFVLDFGFVEYASIVEFLS